MNHLLKYLTVLFLLFSFSSVNLLAVSTSCPGETISNLDGTTSTATQSDSGTIIGYTSYYYKFTPASDGTIQVDSYVDGSWNSLYIRSNCSSALWSNTNDSNSKSSPEIDVVAGQEVIIELYRRYSSSRSFSIDFTYTVTPPPSCSPLRDSANLTTANTFYTNSSHYNDSNWNVGPGSNGGTLSRAYYFTVDGPGDVDIRLYDVDNNQAKFSVAQGSCPSNLQDLTSSQLNFTSAGNFYVYIYYQNGSRTNIEHKLDVTFSPPAPPTMGDVPNTTGTIDTAFTLNISNYVTATNNDAILEYNLTGTLPDGLSFDSSTGIISGTPTAETNATSFSVTATDKDGVSNSDDFTIAIQEFNIVSSGGRNFALRQQENLFGDVRVIGNTVLCQLSNGQCVESGYDISNADVNLQKAPQSSSTLILPTNAVVEYARLYWLGRTDSGWNSTTQAAAGSIEIQKDGGGYTSLTANIKDAINYSGNIWLYSASADASGIVTGAGTYSINTSSFYTVTGDTSDGLGTSGSWALVVIYSDPDETVAKNVTIFDGFKGVTSDDDAQASVVGFLTPKSGVVDSTLYTMAAEGDKYLSGTSDQIQMGGATYNTSLQNLGTFDSRIDLPATRTPNLNNNNGTDIHIYNVGTSNGGAGIIGNNEVGANFNFTSNQDVYYPSLFVFSTELYLPQMCYDYSLKQDGRYLPIDRATYPEAQIDGLISSSDIEVGIYLRNEESDLDAQGIAIRTDLNTTQFNQTGQIYTSNVNGSTLISRGTPSFTGALCDYDKDGDNSVTNNGCTDGHNIRKGNGTLGEFEYVYTQFTIQPQNVSGIVDINESLGMSIKYYIVANGQKIEYPDYILGGENVPICPPTGGYTPQWGQFNVVRGGQTAPITNNLYTQVSRKPFDAAVVFDATPDTGDNQAPSSDVNTTVLVEMIDLDAYGDINASCANPDASISDMIYMPVTFNSSNPAVDIPTQTQDYYNFAVKNATFRIWFFEDKDKTLIQDWGVTTTDSTNRVITSISNLYDSATHTLCSSECSDDTSIGCFECIKTNYAQPLCARDNFSVRPESYSLNLYDINQTLPDYDIETDPANLKNTSKVNLSTVTGYAATSGGTPVNPISLAAGYEYRFDINASGHDGIAPTPGYTRVFNGNPDYNATLIWSPVTGMTGCNDELSRDIAFYFKNGVVINEEREHDNVGIYALSLVDRTWTAVDYLDLSHHTAANGFVEGTTDCDTASSTTTSGTLNGCNIISNHGADGVGNFYKNHSLMFHPYRFDVTGIVSSVGLSHEPLTGNPYIYMADTSNAADENMSYHLNGSITAVGFTGNPLNNFVTNCMAVGLDLNLSKSDTTLQDITGNNIVYHSTFHLLDENNTNTLVKMDTNETDPLEPIRVQTLGSFFIKDANGTMNTINNINYTRAVDTPANPKRVLLNSYDVNCTNHLAECTIFADLRNDKKVSGQLIIDQNLTHYYGRTNTPRQRFITPAGTSSNPAQDFIYYEVYCDLNDGCDKSLLQGGNDANSTNDPRWFINTNHTVGFGTAGNITQKGANRVTATDASGNHQDSTNLVYDASRGYPYKATMENNASSWLIFNRYNPAATSNEFEVEFENAGSSWAGVKETSTTTNNNASSKTNRRTMW